jgi:hypothetical protein
MTPAVPHSRTRNIRRHRVALPLPYEAATLRLAELVPEVDTPRFGQLASRAAVEELAVINAPHGLMRYWTRNTIIVMATDWRCTEYLIGNHVIAEQAFRHTPAVIPDLTLHAALYAAERGQVFLEFDQPGSLLGDYGEAEITAVGTEFDGYLAELVRRLGGEVPPPLE